MQSACGRIQPTPGESQTHLDQRKDGADIDAARSDERHYATDILALAFALLDPAARRPTERLDDEQGRDALEKRKQWRRIAKEG